MSALPYDRTLSDEAPEASMLRVVRGAADEDEIAALVTAIVAVASAPSVATVRPAARVVRPRSAWARPVTAASAAPAPDGWRRSGLPSRRSW